MAMSFTIAIVGRPNVGKSTLFNRLVGKRIALVDDLPGVTRDRREGPARLGDLDFTIIDTAGLEDAGSESLAGRMMAQTKLAIEQADAVFFMLDAKTGPVPDDRAFADLVRRSGKPVIVGREQGRIPKRALRVCSNPMPSGLATRSRSRPSMAKGWSTCSRRCARRCRT